MKVFLIGSLAGLSYLCGYWRGGGMMAGASATADLVVVALTAAGVWIMVARR